MQNNMVMGDKKNNFNWKIFSAVMTLVAIVGVVFGVAMLLTKNGDTKTECDEVAGGNTVVETPDGVVLNPVVEAEAPESFTIKVASPTVQVNDKMVYLTLSLKKGAISDCMMWVRANDGNYEKSGCQINGVDGKIYKIVSMSHSSEAGHKSGLGLIMTDGKVKYLPVDSDNSTINVGKTLPIDGFVVDAMVAEIKNNDYLTGGITSTVFVLSNGEIVALDETIFNEM